MGVREKKRKQVGGVEGLCNEGQKHDVNADLLFHLNALQPLIYVLISQTWPPTRPAGYLCFSVPFMKP